MCFSEFSLAISLHEKLDLHKFTRCKYGAKKCKLRSKSKAKMVNTAFACQFTWGCKFEGKCGIYHLCLLFISLKQKGKIRLKPRIQLKHKIHIPGYESVVIQLASTVVLLG